MLHSVGFEVAGEVDCGRGKVGDVGDVVQSGDAMLTLCWWVGSRRAGGAGGE